MVRPWALAAPIAVLLVTLPLLRPLRHPDPTLVSDDEQARLATIQAIVEHHTLAIERTSFRATRCLVIKPNGHWYSDQSPVMSALLSGPYWVMYHCGLTLDDDPVLAEYLLTLLGVTLPVAFATGLFYRMGRLFELRRPYRAALALAAVVGSGWISYATVLNAGAAAAALVVMGCACLVQCILTGRRNAALAWACLGGLCITLAAVYDVTAAVFVPAMLAVICVFRWSVAHRAAGVALYAVGASLPLLLYGGLNRLSAGDLPSSVLRSDVTPNVIVAATHAGQGHRRSDPETDDDPPTMWQMIASGIGRVFAVLLGGHGVFSHFPVIVFGLIGLVTVMHRHWPATTKVLALATAVAALAIVGWTSSRLEWQDAMFANRWFIVFLPLTLFWAGAWLRRSHSRATWAVAALALGFSALVAIVGATDPQPRDGYARYSAAQAFIHLIQPPEPHRPADMVANR